jgi:hypothetical protein
MTPTYEWFTYQLVQFARRHPDLFEWLRDQILPFANAESPRETIRDLAHHDGLNDPAKLLQCEEEQVFATLIARLREEIAGPRARATTAARRKLTNADFAPFFRQSFFTHAAPVLGVEADENPVFAALFDLDLLRDNAVDTGVIGPRAEPSPRDLVMKCFFSEEGKRKMFDPRSNPWVVVLGFLSRDAESILQEKFGGTPEEALATLFDLTPPDDARNDGAGAPAESVPSLGSAAQRLDAVTVAVFSCQLATLGHIYRDAVSQTIQELDLVKEMAPFQAELAAAQWYFEHSFSKALKRICTAHRAHLPESLRPFMGAGEDEDALSPALVQCLVLGADETLHYPRSTFALPEPKLDARLAPNRRHRFPAPAIVAERVAEEHQAVLRHWAQPS